MTTRLAYFSIDPKGLVALVRNLYWFEQDRPKKKDEAIKIIRWELKRISPDRESLQLALELLEQGKTEQEDTRPDNKAKAINLLKCLNGITDEQIQTILNGDAGLIDVGHGSVKLVYHDDKTFKTRLKKHQTWIASKYIILAGFKVDRELLETYANEVVGRLRRIMRHPEGYRASIMSGGAIEATMRIVEETMELEQLRKELHDEILDSIGLNRERDERSEEYLQFSLALSDYLDQQVGTPFKEE